MRIKNILVSMLALGMFISVVSVNNKVMAQGSYNFKYFMAESNNQGPPPSDAISQKYGFNLVQELILGRTVAYGLLEKFDNKIYTDEAANKYVNLVGQAVAKSASHRPQIKYKFGILDSYEINAFACPGGYIFLTKGLLALLKNENELAAVLAHEIGHVEHGDGLKDINEHKQDEYAKIKMDNLEADIGSISDIAPSFGWYASYYSPKNVAKRLLRSSIPGYGGVAASYATDAAVDVAVDSASKGLKGLAKKIGEKAIKRWYYQPLTSECEYNADAFSVEALAKMGYDPKGIEQFLSSLKELHGTNTGSSGAQNVFSYTHPDVDERIKKAEEINVKVSPSAKNPNAATQPVFTERFKQNIVIKD